MANVTLQIRRFLFGMSSEVPAFKVALFNKRLWSLLLSMKP